MNRLKDKFSLRINNILWIRKKNLLNKTKLDNYEIIEIIEDTNEKSNINDKSSSNNFSNTKFGYSSS